MRPAVPCAALISAVIKKEYKSNKKLLEAQMVRSDATFLSEEGSATNRTALLWRKPRRRSKLRPINIMSARSDSPTLLIRADSSVSCRSTPTDARRTRPQEGEGQHPRLGARGEVGARRPALRASASDRLSPFAPSAPRTLPVLLMLYTHLCPCTSTNTRAIIAARPDRPTWAARAVDSDRRRVHCASSRSPAPCPAASPAPRWRPRPRARKCRHRASQADRA